MTSIVAPLVQLVVHILAAANQAINLDKIKPRWAHSTLFCRLFHGIRRLYTISIEIEENIDLEDLHLVMQKAVDFENDHLYKFYITRTVYSSEPVRFDGEVEGIGLALKNVDRKKFRA